jgi:hypothetical protein
MNHNPETALSFSAEGGQSVTLDAFLFKDNLWELIQALMEERNWALPTDVPERQFLDAVFEHMRGGVEDWVRGAARYFLENSEYFLSSKEALAIFDEEMRQRDIQASGNVRQAFLEFLYRDFPSFCSQAISTAMESVTEKRH